jgi:hypothetical protein
VRALPRSVPGRVLRTHLLLVADDTSLDSGQGALDGFLADVPVIDSGDASDKVAEDLLGDDGRDILDGGLDEIDEVLRGAWADGDEELVEERDEGFGALTLGRVRPARVDRAREHSLAAAWPYWRAELA